MNKTRNLFSNALIFLLAMSFSAPAQAQSRSADRDHQAILVGRISHVEGDVFRYVPEEDDWVVTVKDAPFGLEDGLYAEKGRAELIMPNNTWVRIDKETQIQLLELSQDLTEIDVAQGVARFQNRGSYALIRAETPFGYVTASENNSFEVFVTDEAVDIIPIEGTVEFVHRYSNSRYEVKAGSSSLLVDNRRVIAGEGHEDADWHAWNRSRDILWATRMEHRGESGEYLPSGLYDHAYVLEDHGRWERVYYDGGYHHFWRPVHISVGWSPFTTGRWTYWYGHHTWIPYEPFGYVTHHYGNWVYTHGYWYWAPPMHYGGVHVGYSEYSGYSGFHLDFAWYPGRVAWIHHGYNVGWIPLAPYEPYYCDRYWGSRSVVARNVGVTNVYVNINKYENHGRAVVVRERDFYNVNNYGNVRVRGVSASTVKNQYRTALNAGVTKHNPDGKGKYAFTNARVSRKPDARATAKMRQNRLGIEQRRTAKDKTISKEKTSARVGTAGTKIKRSSTTKKIDPPSVNRSSRSTATLKTQEKRLEKKTTVRTKDLSQTKNSARTQKKVTAPKPLKQQTVARGLQGQRLRETSKSIPKSLNTKKNTDQAQPRVRSEVQKKSTGTSFSSVRKNPAPPPQKRYEKQISGQTAAKPNKNVQRWQARTQNKSTSTSFSSIRKDPAAPPQRRYEVQSGAQRAAKPDQRLQQPQVGTQQRTQAGTIGKNLRSFQASSPKKTRGLGSRSVARGGAGSPKGSFRR